MEIYRNIPQIADRSLGTGRPAAGRPALFFAIYPFSRNNFTYVHIFVIFCRNRLCGRAVICGAEITRLGATDHGAEVPRTHKQYSEYYEEGSSQFATWGYGY